MSDQWLNEALKKGDENDRYADWIDSNEEKLLEEYKEYITFDDIPELFIESQYEWYLEHGEERERERE